MYFIFHNGQQFISWLISNLAGQFYIVGAAPDMLNTGTQRTIAPRGSVPERTIPVSRESSVSRASAVHGEPVCLFVFDLVFTKVLTSLLFTERRSILHCRSSYRHVDWRNTTYNCSKRQCSRKKHPK